MDKTRAVFTGKQGLSGCFALAVLAVLASANAAQGQCQYEVTAIIQAPPCPIVGPPNTFAQGMNIHGHVVGYYNVCGTSSDRAFVWTPEEGFKTLPMPDDIPSSRAFDINDHGVIIGVHTVIGQGDTGFVYDPETGEYTYLEPLHEGTSHSNLTVANAINNNGLVAGARVISKPDVSPPISNAVIWDTKTGDVIDLGVMNGPSSWSRAINDAGDAVGATGVQFSSNVEAWLFKGGQVYLLGPVPGGGSSFANGISASGEIAGAGHLSPSSPDGPMGQAALWTGSKWQLLPLLPGAIHGTAFANNNLGQVAGRNLFSGPGLGQRPVLWQHGLVHEISVPDSPANAVLFGATGICDKGRILVSGWAGTKTVGYVLAPIDRQVTDLNADCVTDVHDLMMLILQWGPCSTDTCPADFTGNGVVNVFDLLFLLANWG